MSMEKTIPATNEGAILEPGNKLSMEVGVTEVYSLDELVQSLVPARLTFTYSGSPFGYMDKAKELLGNRFDAGLPVTRQFERYGLEVQTDPDSRTVTLIKNPH